MSGPTPKTAFKEGVKLLTDGKAAAAIEVFEAGMANASKDKDRGALLYNIAVCKSRLGDHEAAIATLDRAISAAPWLRPRVDKDADFLELRKTDAYQELRRSHRGLYVRTWKWYLAWLLGAILLGFLMGVRTDPFDNAVRLGAMSIPLAWFGGKCTEGFFAFRRGLKRSGNNGSARS